MRVFLASSVSGQPTVLLQRIIADCRVMIGILPDKESDRQVKNTTSINLVDNELV
jgi:hypothetical protein